MSVQRPPTVALLLDAFDACCAAADALPAPARGPALGRVNSGGWIVAHLAAQIDAWWNTGAQGLPPDAWLAEHAAAFASGAPPSAPRFADARAALERAIARARGYLDALDGYALARPAAWRDSRTVGALVARGCAHAFVHAGELAAIGALVGAPDAQLPGPLRHSSGDA
ncbi:MAG: DinB family protein [Chloroflexi bacterium]|nr:DinB family protein [Chloroflexota bacterium]